MSSAQTEHFASRRLGYCYCCHTSFRCHHRALSAALNGEQTHYDYSVLTTKGLYKDKTVKVYKVYSESEKEHVLLEPHAYTSSPSKLTHCSPGFSLHEVGPS